MGVVCKGLPIADRGMAGRMEEAREKSRIYWVLAGVIAIGALLRTIAVGSEELWGDEALTLAIVRFDWIDLFFRPVDPTPGLYYVVQKLVAPWPTDPVIQRLPAVIFGILTIPAAYWLGRELRDRRSGVFVGAMVAFCAPLVDYSQEARAYSLLIFLVTLSAAGALALLRRERAKPGTGAVFFWAAGLVSIYTHLVGWFWFGPAMAIVLLAGWRQGFWSFSKALMVGLLTLLLVLPEAFRILAFSAGTEGQFDWNWHWEPVDLLLEYFALVGPAHHDGHHAMLAVLNRLITLLLLLFLTWLVWRNVRENQGTRFLTPTLLLLVHLAAIPLWLYLAGYLLTPILVLRTMLVGAIGFFGLLALGMPRLPKALLLLLPATMLVETLLVGTIREREPWAEFDTRLSESRADLLVICPANRGGALLLNSPVAVEQYEQIAMISYEGLLLLDYEKPDFGIFADTIWKPLVPAYSGQMASDFVDLEISSLVLLNVACWEDSEREWESERLAELLGDTAPVSEWRVSNEAGSDHYRVIEYEWPEGRLVRARKFRP